MSRTICGQMVLPSATAKAPESKRLTMLMLLQLLFSQKGAASLRIQLIDLDEVIPQSHSALLDQWCP